MITVASASVDQAQAQAAVTSSISKKKINNNKEGEEEEDVLSSSALEEEFLFKSRLPDIEICDDMPLHAYCFERLPELGDRPCLISALTGKTFTFSETHEACLKTAAGLRSLGISSGDAIMILLPNCEHFVFTFMAASFIGALATTANPFYTASEISKQLQASKAKLIVTQSHYLPKLKHIITGSSSKIVVIDDDHKDRDDDDDDDEWCLTSVIPFSELLTMEEEVKENTAPPPFSPSAPVALPFSSGTTGLPKGVVLTHKSLITSVAQQVDGDNPNLELRREDVVLCVLPLFHIFSLNSVLLCSLRAGASVLLLPKFEINSLLSLIQLHRVTVAAVVPPLVMALAKNPDVARYDLSSIRLILSGAAPLAKDLIQALQARLPNAILGQGYGMTEAGPVLTMCMSFAKLPSPTKSGSCGTVVRNAELKVVDPETGRSLGYNQPGEICIRGDQIMKGYLNDDAATAATIDSDSFLHTGDIGYVDDDDEVFIVDRVKELIKFKGFQVPPAELEALLVSHPLIADAAAVPQKDEVAGEVPVAFVVRSNGAELTEEDVKEFIAKQVVFYKRLHKVYFVESIPKSPSGKILRKDLRAKLIASASV